MNLPDHLTGYRRADGRAGVRNLVLVMAAADNVNPVLPHLKTRCPQIVTIPASYGRGQLGEDLEITLNTMAGLAAHPNVAGCLVIAFERASAERILQHLSGRGDDLRHVSFLDAGGLEPCLLAAEQQVEALSKLAARSERTSFGWDEFAFGLECGGSDTTSGLYANPALGRLCDALHERGSILVFSEPVECLGGEASLTERARTSHAADTMLAAIRRFETIARDAGVSLTGINPTADNIAGGLSTIEEKSLGAIAKTGIVPIEGCVGYGEMPEGPGLWMMDAPAAAVENLTALAAGGCQMTGFVTGSGNPIGHTIMPTLKITANRETASTMPDHVDADLSQHFVEGSDLDTAAQVIGEALVSIANGQPTAAENLRFLCSNISRFGKSV